MKRIEVVNELVPKLNMYVPVVDRVHGGSHPEFHEVRRIYEEMVSKIGLREDLSDSFIRLREVTSNYTVPGDVCESYEAVYKMLEQIDSVYRK